MLHAGVVLAVATPLILLYVWHQWRQKISSTYSGFRGVSPAPVVPGLPVIGNALSMKNGAAFIQQCHDQFGDCFTLRLLGQRMTFLFGSPAMERYFNSPDSQITFGPAVQQFTHRIFGLPPKHFFGKHSIMLGALRDQLAPAQLPRYACALLQHAERELEAWPREGEMELYSALQALVFKVSVDTLFGPAFLAAQNQAPSFKGGCRPPPSLHTAFFEFEACFELAASPLPHLFLPRFRRSRAHLLAALRSSYEAGHFAGSVADTLINACSLPPPFIPNMLLALLWASQANSVPATFWSLGFLLLPENQGTLRQLLSQLGVEPQQAQQTQQQGGKAAGRNAPGAAQQHEQQGQQDASSPLLATALDRQSLLVRCVVEALRLRAMSIDVRVAAADVALPAGKDGKDLLIQKGSIVALSPYASHQDPRLFGGQSMEFDPDREGMRFGGSHAAHAAVVGVGGLAGLSFGGGKYRCPGRYFAEVEVALLLGLLLSKFEFRLTNPPPTTTAASQATGRPLPGDKQGAAPAQHGDLNLSRAGGGGARWERDSRDLGRFPGDPGGLLPPPDLRKLVGVKAPARQCWVRFARR